MFMSVWWQGLGALLFVTVLVTVGWCVWDAKKAERKKLGAGAGADARRSSRMTHQRRLEQDYSKCRVYR